MELTEDQLKGFLGGSVEIVDFRIFNGIVRDIKIIKREIIISLSDISRIVEGEKFNEKGSAISINSETYVIQKLGENRLCISRPSLGQNIILTRKGAK